MSFVNLVTLTAAGVPHGDPISPRMTFSVTGFTCIVCSDDVTVQPNFALPHPLGTLSVGLPATDVFTTRTFDGPTSTTARQHRASGASAYAPPAVASVATPSAPPSAW